MKEVDIELSEDEESVKICVVLPERRLASEKIIYFTKRDALAEFVIRGHSVKSVSEISGPDLLTNYTTKSSRGPTLEGEFVLAKQKKQVKKEKVEIKPKPKASNRRKPRSKRKSVEDQPGAKSTTTTIED